MLPKITADPTQSTTSLGQSEELVLDAAVSQLSFLTRVRGRLLHPLFWLLLVPGLIIIRGIADSELYFYGDEMRHAMNGVFFRDVLVDFPIRHPMQYALEYYAKYPAIAVGHWPPLFHLIGGLFFLVFGVSAWVSKLPVLCFALMGLFFWYRIAEMQGPKYRAFLSGLIFAVMPYILSYERTTMLEIPSVATCLGTIYFWMRFLEKERPRDLWAVAAFAAASFLISQKAIFLVAFFALHFILERRFRLLRRWDVWVALACSLGVVLPWYLLAEGTVAPLVGRGFDPTFGHMLSNAHLIFYLEVLPKQAGIPLLCLAVAGMVWALLTQARQYRFFLLWVVSCYLCFTLIPEKDTRHTMVWFPPLVYFALLAVEVLFLKRKIALVAQSALAMVFVVNGVRHERPYVRGVENVVRHVLALPESDIVYYQGNLDGNFVFLVREHDPQKTRMVTRDKQVVVTKIVYDKRRVLTTPGEVVDFFQKWGIRYAIIESGYSRDGLEPAFEAFQSEAFELVQKFPLESNIPKYGYNNILLYRFRGDLQRSSEPVVVPMMTIRNNIRADLSRLAGRPWPN